MKKYLSFFLVLLSFIAAKNYSQNLNLFAVPNGKSGVGPVPAGGAQDLFHIHGWLPNQFQPWLTYINPALRISLEDQNFLVSPIYGQLAMQNSDEFGAGATPRVFSNLAKKYDFVLTTTETFDPNFYNLQGEHPVNIRSYTYDLILSTKNPFASMHFATTPQSATLGTIADLERMTIYNSGCIGIQTINSIIPNTSITNTIGPIPVRAPLQVGNIAIQPCAFGSGGTWGSISYNNWWDPTVPIGKRLKDGAANGLVFQPESPDHSTDPTMGGGHNGGIYMFAAPAADIQNHASIGTRSTFLLAPEKLLLYLDNVVNNQDHWCNLMQYTFPSVAANGTANSDGIFFIRDNVGISNTAPVGPLQVGSNLLTVLANGNVGVGTASPGALFEVGNDFLNVLNSGMVLIGTDHLATGVVTPFSGAYKLAVKGSILAQELVIDARAVNWPDFVFNGSFELIPLKELDRKLKKEHHLPGMPNAHDVEKNGIAMGDFQAKLLQKIEELTLYVIQLKKENESLNERLIDLEK
jgi:hypothetical protein